MTWSRRVLQGVRDCRAETAASQPGILACDVNWIRPWHSEAPSVSIGLFLVRDECSRSERQHYLGTADVALHWRKAHGSGTKKFSGAVGGGAGWETFNRTSDLNLALQGNSDGGPVAKAGLHRSSQTWRSRDLVSLSSKIPRISARRRQLCSLASWEMRGQLEPTFATEHRHAECPLSKRGSSASFISGKGSTGVWKFWRVPPCRSL